MAVPSFRQISRGNSGRLPEERWAGEGGGALLENLRSNAEGSCGSWTEIAARVAENVVAPILLFGRPSGCNCVEVVAFATGGEDKFPRGVRGN